MRSNHRLCCTLLLAALLGACASVGEREPRGAPAPAREEDTAARTDALAARPAAEPERDPPRSGLRHDPIEDDPRHAEVFAQIDAEVNALLKDHPARGGEGFCHVVWATKKRLLESKYGIAWRSPDELNPHVIFD